MTENLMVSRPLTCPICENKFDYFTPRAGSYHLISRDPDFCPHYGGINPLFYQIWVCPSCHYAAQKSHWQDLSDWEKKHLLQLQDELKDESFCDFSNPERNLSTATQSFQLAYRYYSHRRAGTSNVLGTLQLHLAWMYRFEEELLQEKAHLDAASNHLLDAYDDTSSPKMVFLIAETLRKAGKHTEAMNWFMQVLQDVNAYGEINRLARDQMDEARSAARMVPCFQKFDFFEPFGPELLSFLATHSRRRTFHPQQTICQQGEEGESLFIITSGSAKVYNSPESPPVATWGPQDFFGELPFLYGRPYQNTVISQEECKVLHIPRMAFQALIHLKPELKDPIFQILEAHDQETMGLQPQEEIPPKRGFFQRIKFQANKR